MLSSALDVGLHVATLSVLGLAALHALLNHLLWPRLLPPGGRGLARRPRVSVLIPARNEARRIGAALQAWIAQTYSDYEVLVFDDDSDDDTAARVAALAGAASRLRLLRGGALPPGWRGKPWACHNLARQAAGEILVFADADVVPARQALEATVARLGSDCDVLSAVPRHRASRPGVLALAALQNWAALAFVPAWLARVRPLAAVNGQYLALSRDVYWASGGFAAVRGRSPRTRHSAATWPGWGTAFGSWTARPCWRASPTPPSARPGGPTPGPCCPSCSVRRRCSRWRSGR